MDEGYLRDAAQAVKRYVWGMGKACELAFMPGNGTVYDLILTPAPALYSVSNWMDHANARSIAKDRPELQGDREDEWLHLSWIGHGCWPVDLRSVWLASYFAEKFHDCSLADGEALRALLLMVAVESGIAQPVAAA